MTASISDWKNIVEREKVTKYLPYVDYLEKEGVYIAADGGVGFIFECSPLTFANQKTHSAITSALSMLPDGADIQFIFYASPDVTDIIEEWADKKTNNDDLTKAVTNEYKKFLYRKTDTQISRSFSAPVRQFKLAISVKIGGAKKSTGLFDSFKDVSTILNSLKFITGVKDSDKEYTAEYKKKIAKLLQVKERFRGALSGGNLYSADLKPDGLINFLWPIFNQKHNFLSKPKWDGSYINNFIFANDNTIEITKNHIISDGVLIKTLSTKEYPQEWNIGYVINFAGNILDKQNHSSPFLFTLNVTKLSDSNKDSIKTRAAITSGQRMPYSLFPKLKIIHKDLEYGMEKLEQGESPYYVTFNVAVFGKNGHDVDKASGEIQSFFKGLGYRLENDLYITFPMLMTMLPLGYNNEIQEFLGMERGRIVFGENVADLVPICGDWQGTSTSGEVLFLSPRGQAFKFDLFANNAGGYNAFCVGMTGAGKSVFLQYLATNYYMSGDKIWIIDIGRSYERFAHAFNGQFIELSLKNPISLNPFTHIKNNDDFEEYLEFLQSLFLLMGLPKEKQLSEQLEKLIKSYLEEALRLSFQKYGSKSDIDTVLEQLENLEKKNDDNRLDDFIRTMMPYRKGKQYGSFLNGESNINFSSNIVVLECDTLESIPDLLNPALMLLSFQISKEIYLEEKTKDKKNRHIVIMDEAHKFLKSGHIELFVEQAYRRFRKHGASMILGTQGFEDFYGGEKISQVGRVIVQNSYWNFFMLQKKTSIEAIKKSNYFNFGEYENALMDSVSPVDKEYGEVLIVSDNVTTKGRIVLDQFMQTMFFTTKELRTKIYKLIEQGYTYLEAINIVQRKHPRMPMDGMVSIKAINAYGEKETYDIKILDISEGGCAIALNEDMDSLHLISMTHPNTNKEVEIVVRRKEYIDNIIKTGVEFQKR